MNYFLLIARSSSCQSPFCVAPCPGDHRLNCPILFILQVLSQLLALLSLHSCAHCAGAVIPLWAKRLLQHLVEHCQQRQVILIPVWLHAVPQTLRERLGIHLPSSVLIFHLNQLIFLAWEWQALRSSCFYNFFKNTILFTITFTFWTCNFLQLVMYIFIKNLKFPLVKASYRQ